MKYRAGAVTSSTTATATGKAFRWPRQSERIQDLIDGVQRASDLDSTIVKRLQDLGIYRNGGEEEKPANDVVDAARKSGKNIPRNKVRKMRCVPRKGMEKTAEQMEDVPELVYYYIYGI